MIEFLKSQDLKSDVSRILNKNFSDVTDSDLQQISKLSLSKENIFGGCNDYQISDLEFFKNLKQCSISGFEISDQDVTVINNLSNLEFLEFDFCEFKLISKSICNDCLKNLYLDKCNNLKIININSSNLKSLSIVGAQNPMDILDFGDFVFLSDLEDCEVHHYNVANVENIFSSVPNIKSLNFDGSKISNQDVLSELRANGIEVSNEEFFHLH